MIGLEIDGEWSEDPRRLKEFVHNHFCRHFQKHTIRRVRLENNAGISRLEEEDGERLTCGFSEEEVRNAVWECDSSKSPGPNGFNMCFFKACWFIIKNDLMRVVHEFHSNGRLVKGSNSSFIVLIPKKDGACGLNQFRPISLIGCLYKVIAKVLSRRLKMVMHKLIGEPQSAFISGRNILDGAVVLNEVVEEAKKSKKERLVFKVDFTKAFDTVDWAYLLDMLHHMNFPAKWIRWMSGCISSASANVLLNGVPSGDFVLERGCDKEILLGILYT